MFTVFRHYWPSIHKYRAWGVLTLIGLICGVCSDAAQPFFIRRIIDELTVLIQTGGESGSTEVIQTMFIYIISVALLRIIVFWRLFDVGINNLAAKTMVDLDDRSYEATRRQSEEFFADYHSAKLVSMIQKFRSSFEGMADIALGEYGRYIMLITFIMLVFLIKMPILALVLTVWLLFFIGTNVILSYWKYKKDVLVSDSDSDVKAFLGDTIVNQAVVKHWGMEDTERKRLQGQLQDNYCLRIQAWNCSIIINFAQGLLMGIAEWVFLYILIERAKQGNFTIGDFIFYQSYVLWLFSELWSFGHSLRRWFYFSADAEPMCAVYESFTEVPEVQDAKPLQVPAGQITFSNVHFSYPKSKTGNSTLNGINLQIAAGESVGLVGKSGAGKSTIVKALMRFYDLHTGSICIDGQNIAEVQLQSVRQAISLVPQDPMMFHRSLLENIRFGRPNATKEEVILAAKQAHAWDFIQEQELGLNTLVGERGILLSGGQRQRIALARAFVADTPILMLDEATSSLDSETEQHIQTAVSDLIQNRTSIIIAHRFSTIMQLDRIVVLENGQISEQGTHQELIKSNGIYADLWKRQTNDQLPR